MVTLRIRLALALFIFVACTQAANERCFVELPVYDAFGNRLEFSVTRVSPEGESETNLLTLEPHNVSSVSNRLWYAKRTMSGRSVEIVLEDAKGHRIVKAIVLVDCPQRTSVRFGHSEAEWQPDVTGVLVTGRVTGCKFDGDWWVRALPMFGDRHPFDSIVEDGHVQPDGTFHFSVIPEGVRHLLIVGKGREPLKVTGFDVTVGKKSNIGTIDLSAHCPRLTGTVATPRPH